MVFSAILVLSTAAPMDSMDSMNSMGTVEKVEKVPDKVPMKKEKDEPVPILSSEFETSPDGGYSFR